MRLDGLRQEYSRTLILFLLVGLLLTGGCELSKSSPQPTDTTAPANVTGFKASVNSLGVASGFADITMRWQDPPDNDLAHVSIHVAPNVVEELEISAGEQTAVLNEVPNGRTYTFNVRTVDKAGNASDVYIYSIGTSADGREVTNIRTVAGDGCADLSWDDPDFQGFCGIRLSYYKEGNVPIASRTGDEEIITVDFLPGVEQAAVENLINGKKYSFHLQSIDDTGYVSPGYYGGCMPMAPPTPLPAGVTYNKTNGLLVDRIRDVFVAEDGTVVLATLGGGVSIYDGFSWTNYTENDGLPSNYVHSVYVDASGLIYAATNSNGIAVYDGSSWQQYGQDLFNKEMQGAYGDSNGTVYFGTQIKGVYEFKDDVLIPISGIQGPANIDDLFVDTMDNLYVAAYDLFIYNGISWTRFNILGSNNRWFNDIRCIYALSTNQLVLGSYGDGLCVYDGVQWTTYTTEQGLPCNYVEGVWMDADGTILAGTQRGLGYFDGSSWTNYSSVDWTHNNRIYEVVKDDSGKVYIATNEGLTVVILE